MGRGIKIFLYYVLLPLVVIALAFCFFSTPILRLVGIERGTFGHDVWEKGVFLGAEKNNCVILSLCPADNGNLRFFLGKYEIKSLSWFMFGRGKDLIIIVKDREDKVIDRVKLNVKPGDIVGYEIAWNNDGSYQFFNLCVNHSDYTYEKIPVVLNNPFKAISFKI